ncbi:MAG TPA: carboxypeptidase-like regulatory domain-containing protein, partial [Acidobacteriaceae bacterium]|nr:carboxypeptidase-like regulatory domain-containing protein [Acidobacteriaceae bacterium]
MGAAFRSRALLALCVGVLLLVPLTAFSQVEAGRFVGRITDPQGAVVPNATVTATNTGTNIVQTATTNGNGEFVITPVSAGIYTLTVTAPGFEKLTTSTVEVQVGQVVREDLSLRVGTASTTVEVNVAPPLLNTDTATVGQVITNAQIVNLPLNGRGFYQLAELTPGAALLPPTGNVLPIRPEQVDGNTISGIRGRAISFLLDGVDVSEQHQGGTFIQTSIDALQEFSVQQNPYSAEFNRGGGFFNATTKSGTNQFHGGVFEFIRNDKLDARNFFASTRQILKRNQFGGDLGGPLSFPHLYSGKDKTFFFVDYEGQRLRQGLIFNSIVPTLAQRTGDFSGSGLKPIYDPLTTTTANGVTTRKQFPGNVIPADRLSAQALAVQKYYETPNNPTGTARFTPSQAIDWDQYTGRLDDQLNKSNRLFARFFYVDNRETDPNAAPALKTASLTSNAYDLAFGVITTIGANKVQDFRIHYLPSHIRLSAFLQGPDFNAANGITGFSQTLRPNVGGAFPDFAFSGYTSLQGAAFDQRPKSQDRIVFEPTDNFTIIKGRNSIKFGVLVRYYQWLGYDSQQFVGNWNFTGSETQNPASPSSTGDAYADFLLGYPFSSQRAYPAINFGGQRWYYQFFGQDDIRLTSHLTVNVGLRYEYSPWLNGYRGQIGTFNPALTKPIIVASHNSSIDLGAQPAAPIAYQYFGYLIQTSAQAGLPYSITYTDRKQFAPRVGFAWSPIGDKTVFRGGYGIFY